MASIDISFNCKHHVYSYPHDPETGREQFEKFVKEYTRDYSKEQKFEIIEHTENVFSFKYSFWFNFNYCTIEFDPDDNNSYTTF